MVPIALVICPDTILSSLCMALDSFELANRLADTPLFAVRTVSADGQPVTIRHATLRVDGDLSDIKPDAQVLVPAIGARVREVIASNPTLLAWLRARGRAQQPLASICSAAFLLGAAGVLDERRATTHWALADPFRSSFPRARLHIDQLVTHDGPVSCSGGAQAGVDLCLDLVRRHGGDWLARQTASMLVFEHGRGPQTRFTPRLPPQSTDPALAQLQRWLEQHHARPLTLDDMAARLHCSTRTLLRRFKDATGLTPNDYLQRVRIAAAEARLTDTRLPVEQIAAEVGYDNRTAFAKLFKQVTGETPAAYRQRCRAGVDHDGTR